MFNLDDLKLELPVTNKLNRLELIKARAQLRTKRRIAEQLENKVMKDLEEKVAAQNIQTNKEALELSTVGPQDTYTTSVTANGNTQYRRNGSLISKAEYESHVGN